MPESTLSGEFELNENNPSESEISDAIENTPTEEPTPISEPKRPEERSTPHFYSSFGYYPRRVKFVDQEKDEEIILFIRRRFITNLTWILSIGILALLPPFIFPMIFSTIPIHPFTSMQTILIIFFYYLVIFGFLLMKFTLWYFHVGILTNKRIKDIDIHGILFKDVSETRINLLQDVNYKQIGLIPSLFNYGDIFVQTAGPEPIIEFDKAPRPTRVARIIADMLKSH